MAQIGQPYTGNELWVIPDNAQPTGIQTFLQNFQSQAIRSNTLAQSAYGTGNKQDVNVFLSKDTVKNLMGGVVGTTPRSGVVGILLKFGYDTVASKILLIAHSANNVAARPTGAEYANFNYLSNTTSVAFPNAALTDAEVDVFTANFRSNGHTFLANLANGAAISVKFDNHVMARLLYADVGPVPTIGGQSEFHLIVAPPWDGETGLYLSVAGRDINAANGSAFTGNPPCPPYCA